MATVTFSLYREQVVDDQPALVRVAEAIDVEDSPGGTKLSDDEIAEAVARAYHDMLDANKANEPDDVARAKRAGVFVAVRPERLHTVRVTAERTYAFAPAS